MLMRQRKRKWSLACEGSGLLTERNKNRNRFLHYRTCVAKDVKAFPPIKGESRIQRCDLCVAVQLIYINLIF